ncbi:hypothetical protein PMIT1342_00467 [Prochlorococcus marinus str. MIT 1342]|uniref:hypothetical protein n=1 Tax=Prochlorococcus TaxID=1218 RepID=UPI0007BC58E0|nr:hypothetical protein [Prochlorococcus marinus]KZR83108.1 hypothetical protein PMIT1342_00467 [Prochlorococcus marinus str. MIT 1342]
MPSRSGLVGDYFPQDSDSRLSLNEIVDLQYDSYLGEEANFSDQFKPILPKGEQRYFDFIMNSGVNSSHFPAILDQGRYEMSCYWFTRNRQSRLILAHFGHDFIDGPRLSTVPLDLMIPTEFLDLFVSHLVASGSIYSSFFEEGLQGDSPEEVWEKLRIRRKNVTSDEVKSNDLCTMSSASRYKFYLINRFDYSLWQASVCQVRALIEALEFG